MVRRIIIALYLSFFGTASAQRAVELRAVKITNVDSDVLNSIRSIAKAIDYLHTIGINTILAVVWNGSGTGRKCGRLFW